tara:strand:+ start:251 stop:838 length:588 start_codon:yes stop_codon:yes gene_type:complete
MKSLFREILDALVLSLVVFLLIQVTIQNFKVEGASMYPTLKSGQYVLVNKLAYANLNQVRLSKLIPFWNVTNLKDNRNLRSPARGEIIVFRFPDHNPDNRKRDFVKRVIAVPGDKIAIISGVVWVNDKSIQEGYLKYRDTFNMDERILKETDYFVLGDNRTGSNDSRAWGPVPEVNILGKVWSVYWPLTDWGRLH